ncbi:MAG: exo-alpha-sialidase [Planctomycetota bacterium]|jgi:sialidase-1
MLPIALTTLGLLTACVAPDLKLSAERPALPCLIGRLDNPALRVTLTVREPSELREARFDLIGTTVLDDVTGLSVRIADRDFGGLVADDDRVVVPLDLALEPGEYELVAAIGLTRDADLDGHVRVDLDQMTLADGSIHRTDASGSSQRLGLALRSGGDDGAAVYRIPALTTTTAGSLVAAYDIRWRGWGDLPADIDVGLSRSTDGGRSWEPMRVALDAGDDPKARYDGVGDPAILVDRTTGRIWIAALWSHGDNGWHGSGPGLAPDRTGQLLLTWSDDDGVSWSEPRNLTAEVKDPSWALFLDGPGRGIQMADGTLVFAAQFRDAPERGRKPHSTILYSRDHGETWEVGTGAKPDTTEAQVVEIEEGVLMLNMRDDRGGARSVAITRDLGATWEEHATSRRALIEPVCNAGLVRVDSGLYFTNPAVDAPPRRRMAIRASYDLGRSWPERAQLVLDEGRSAGYSSLTVIDDATVGVLFEGSRAQLIFMRIPLEELPR